MRMDDQRPCRMLRYSKVGDVDDRRMGRKARGGLALFYRSTGGDAGGEH